MAFVTDDACEMVENVSSQWSNAGNREYYVREPWTKHVSQGLLDARPSCENVVKPTLIHMVKVQCVHYVQLFLILLIHFPAETLLLRDS
ncbi:unnamed protein product [Protopolystoma xenopodis]|uniref:Uncharacterized protein n=1 Tax=Protopolystoma xenopodis TaxID=117903 RepID=A0A3S5BTV3_9PLAT|nr:unnamed protein product [Protopolystoma xenopodis]